MFTGLQNDIFRVAENVLAVPYDEHIQPPHELQSLIKDIDSTTEALQRVRRRLVERIDAIQQNEKQRIKAYGTDNTELIRMLHLDNLPEEVLEQLVKFVQDACHWQMINNGLESRVPLNDGSFRFYASEHGRRAQSTLSALALTNKHFFALIQRIRRCNMYVRGTTFVHMKKMTTTSLASIWTSIRVLVVDPADIQSLPMQIYNIYAPNFQNTVSAMHTSLPRLVVCIVRDNIFFCDSLHSDVTRVIEVGDHYGEYYLPRILCNAKRVMFKKEADHRSFSTFDTSAVALAFMLPSCFITFIVSLHISCHSQVTVQFFQRTIPRDISPSQNFLQNYPTAGRAHGRFPALKTLTLSYYAFSELVAACLRHSVNQISRAYIQSVRFSDIDPSTLASLSVTDDIFPQLRQLTAITVTHIAGQTHLVAEHLYHILWQLLLFAAAMRARKDFVLQIDARFIACCKHFSCVDNQAVIHFPLRRLFCATLTQEVCNVALVFPRASVAALPMYNCDARMVSDYALIAEDLAPHIELRIVEAPFLDYLTASEPLPHAVRGQFASAKESVEWLRRSLVFDPQFEKLV